MKSLARLGIVTFSLTALLLVGGGTTFASHQPRTNARHATSYGKLTVNITLASGTVWGSVSISPLKKTCKVARCTFKVKQGAKLKLTQTPVDQTTWPWGGWTLNKKNGGFANTLKFKMGKSATVTAVYQLPETLTINITKTSTLW